MGREIEIANGRARRALILFIVEFVAYFAGTSVAFYKGTGLIGGIVLIAGGFCITYAGMLSWLIVKETLDIRKSYATDREKEIYHVVKALVSNLVKCADCIILAVLVIAALIFAATRPIL